MADNVTITQGTGTDIAADEISSVKYQRVKLVEGADGVNDGDISSANPLPVELTDVDGTAAADITAIKTACEILDNAISGSEMQVDVVTLPAITATNLDIRDLTNASDSVAIYGSDDGGTTKRIIETDSGGAVAIQDGGNTITVDGTVTANAGTNLNTSALALETGGNLATIAGDTTSIDGKITACNTGAVTISAALPAGTNNIGDVDVASIAAGDNNIGNVDIVSLPAGNLGQQAMAASLSVVPANNITDATYIGDIKFGESLPAGTNAIGKLAANSGVDIGDVDVTSLPALAAGTATIGSVFPNQYELAGNTTHVKKYYTSAGAATDGIIWSPAAGKRWYITDLIINVSAAATVTLEDDLAAGDSAVFKAELAANSGISHSFNTPLYSGEDAADLLITTSAGNVYVTVTGYEI